MSDGTGRWVMCYQRGRTTRFGTEHVVGSTVVKEHPLIVLRRWNEMYHQEAERDRLPRMIVVLTWYEELSDDALEKLVAAGIDLDTQDHEISL